VLFAFFSVVSVVAGKRAMSGQGGQDSDRPNLNRRMYDYLGNTYVLEDAIVNGRGKVRIEDTLWEVVGPDLPKGARVKVAGVDNLRLRVDPA
jgi:membrane protein implicated in regulation of membrane protease activity